MNSRAQSVKPAESGFRANHGRLEVYINQQIDQAIRETVAELGWKG